MSPPAIDPAVLKPERPADWAHRGFGVITKRMLTKKFHAALMTPEASKLFDAVDAHAGPALLCLNHPGWWDPITLYALGRTRLPSRYGCGPIDMRMLEQFKIFNRVGLFGIEPEHPNALDAMQAHFRAIAEAHPKPTMLLTPQGRFADVRTPAKLRPGASALAAANEGTRVLCCAVEYCFWEDQKPELLLHAVEAERSATVTGWHRTITRAFRTAQAQLAELATARDPAAFEPAFDWFAPKASGDVHPVYNLVLKLRGKSGVVSQRETAR